MNPRLNRLRRTMDYLRGSHDGVASLEQAINVIMHEFANDVPGIVWGRIGATIQESLESSGRLATAAERQYLRLAYGKETGDADSQVPEPRSETNTGIQGVRRYGGIDGG